MSYENEVESSILRENKTKTAWLIGLEKAKYSQDRVVLFSMPWAKIENEERSSTSKDPCSCQ